MENDKISWGMEAIQLTNELAGMAKDVGVPGVGLLGRFTQHFYSKYLLSRFDKFIKDANVNEELLEKVIKNENYSNCFYSVLETVRRTHSKLGLIVLALIYKDYWNNDDIIVPAMSSFAEISDSTIDTFIELYESIPEDKNYLELHLIIDGNKVFHDKYKEAVELINRNIFIQSSYSGIAANMPIQGMKWDNTVMYYKYCKDAKKIRLTTAST